MKRGSRIVLPCFLLCAIVFVPWSKAVYADGDSEARLILETMSKAYLGLSTYQDTGVVETTSEARGQQGTSLTGTFAISFKRPSSLRLEYVDMIPRRDLRLLLSHGGESLFYHPAVSVNRYKRVKLEDELYMGAGFGGSFGTQHTVPRMLLEGFDVSALSELSLLPQEDVEGMSCVVIAAKRGGDVVKLWIGVADHMLRKGEMTSVSRKADYQAGKGKETADRMEQSSDFRWALAARIMKQMDWSMTFREIHREIKVDKELGEGVFLPPAGAKLLEDVKVGQ